MNFYVIKILILLFLFFPLSTNSQNKLLSLKNDTTLSAINIRGKGKRFILNRLKQNLRTVNYAIAGNHNFRKKYFPYISSNEDNIDIYGTRAGNFMEEAVYIPNIKGKNMYIQNIKFYLRDNFYYNKGTVKNEIFFLLRIYNPLPCSLSYSKSKWKPGNILYQIRDTIISKVQHHKELGEKNILKKGRNPSLELISYNLKNKYIKFPKEGIFISLEPISCNQYGECSPKDSILFKKRETVVRSSKTFITSFCQSAGLSKGGLQNTPAVFIKDKRNGKWYDITFEKLLFKMSNKEQKKSQRLKKQNIKKWHDFTKLLVEQYYLKAYQDLDNIFFKGKFYYPLYQVEFLY